MKMTVVFKSNLSGVDILDKTVPLNVNAGNRWLAFALVDEIRSNWSSDSPSSPGEAPAVDTGKLDASVVAEPAGRDLLGRFTGKDAYMQVVRIGAPYSGFLEHGTRKMDARPFVLPAVLRTADKVPEAYRNIFSFRINQSRSSGGEEE